MSAKTQAALAETKAIHFFDINACIALTPRDRLLAIMRAGRLLNAFSWHGQQAWLIGSRSEKETALISLDHLACAVLVFSSAEEGDALNRAIRGEQSAFQDCLSGEGFMDAWESKNEELFVLAQGQPTNLPLLLVEERKAFLAPFFRTVDSLRSAIMQTIRSEERGIFQLGDLVDRGLRPSSEICWHVCAPKPVANVGKPFDPLKCLGKPGVTRQERLLGNCVIERDTLPRPSGWMDEVRCRWQRVYVENIAPMPEQSAGVQRLIEQFNDTLLGKEKIDAKKRYEIPGKPILCIAVDSTTRTVHREGYSIVQFKRRQKEFELFRAFLDGVGGPCSADVVMKKVWPERKKLDSTLRNSFDKTKTGVNELLSTIRIKIQRQESGGFMLVSLPDAPGQVEPKPKKAPRKRSR